MLKRYDVFYKDSLGYEGQPLSREYSDGEWCRYEDVEARLADVTAERDAMRAAMDDFIKGYYDPEGTPNLEYYAHQFEAMLLPTVSAKAARCIRDVHPWCPLHGSEKEAAPRLPPSAASSPYR